MKFWNENLYLENYETYEEELLRIYPEVKEAYTLHDFGNGLGDGLILAKDYKIIKTIVKEVFRYVSSLKKSTTKQMLLQIYHIIKTGEYRYLFENSEDNAFSMFTYDLYRGTLKNQLLWAARWIEYYDRIYFKADRSPEENVDIKTLLAKIESEALDKEVVPTTKEMEVIPFPVKLWSHIEKHMVGQDELKLLTLVINRYLNRGTRKNTLTLIKGPTGSGKNYVFEVISQFPDIKKKVPILIYDVSNNSPAGFHGNDLEDIVNAFKTKALSMGLPQNRGIIFLNEFDKLLTKNYDSKGTDVNKVVQQQLLATLEGSTTIKGVDTSDLLWIIGGAFTDMDLKEENERSRIGFETYKEDDKKDSRMDSYQSLQERLLEYGMERELLGRVSTIINMKKLDETDMKRIMLHEKHGYLRKKQDEFFSQGWILDFTEEAVDLIAKKAVESELGARALFQLINRVTDAYQFTMYEHDYEKIVIHKDAVLGSQPLFVKKGGKIYE